MPSNFMFVTKIMKLAFSLNTRKVKSILPLKKKRKNITPIFFQNIREMPSQNTLKKKKMRFASKYVDLPYICRLIKVNCLK